MIRGPANRQLPSLPTDQSSTSDSPIGSRTPDPGSRLRKKLTFNESRELESLPSRIAALEEEQTQLQAEAASPAFYKESAEHIRRVLARIDQLGPELDAAMARWVDLEDRA